MHALPRKRGTIAVLFLVWATWLAVPYFGFGRDSYVRIYDNGDGILPGRVSLSTASPSHLSTAWNPIPLAGVDQVPWSSNSDADGWLFSVLPGWLAYGLVMFAQRFIAGYFTCRLLKDRLGLGVLASLGAGLTYAFFSQITLNEAWAGFTLYDGLCLAGLPLLLWALDGEAGWSLRWRLLIAVGLGLLLGFTSHYFAAVFVVFAVAVWLLIRGRKSGRQTMLVVAMFALAWAIAEAPVVWGSLLTATQSQRTDRALQTLSLRAAISARLHFVLSIVLDNRLMVEVAILGLVATRFRNRALIVALGASAMILLLVLPSAVWLTGLRPYLGPLAEFDVSRFYLLAPFALIVSGALGLDALAAKLRGRLPSDGGRRGRVWAASLTLLALLVLGPLASVPVQARILQEMRAGSSYAALYERPELRRLAAGSPEASPYRVATVYAPQAFTAPKDSTWPELFGQLPAYAWAYGFETVDGYVSLFPGRYQRFWGCVTDRALRSDKSMSDKYWNWGNRVYLFIPQPGVGWWERQGMPLPTVTDIDHLCNMNLLSLANVRYLISPVRLSGAGLSLVSGDQRGKPWPLYIYENTRVLPRYFVVGSSRAYADLPGLLTALGDASLGELRTVAFTETRASAGLDLPKTGVSTGQVRLVTYGADRISLSVEARDRSLVVCTMNYSPYWRAYVDGREANVMPVDCTFIGVAITGGTHRVELHYQPPYAWLFPG